MICSSLPLKIECDSVAKGSSCAPLGVQIFNVSLPPTFSVQPKFLNVLLLQAPPTFSLMAQAAKGRVSRWLTQRCCPFGSKVILSPLLPWPACSQSPLLPQPIKDNWACEDICSGKPFAPSPSGPPIDSPELYRRWNSILKSKENNNNQIYKQIQKINKKVQNKSFK